jgi:hypothetical protein
VIAAALIFGAMFIGSFGVLISSVLRERAPGGGLFGQRTVAKTEEQGFYWFLIAGNAVFCAITGACMIFFAVRAL